MGMGLRILSRCSLSCHSLLGLQRAAVGPLNRGRHSHVLWASQGQRVLRSERLSL